MLGVQTSSFQLSTALGNRDIGQTNNALSQTKDGNFIIELTLDYERRDC